MKFDTETVTTYQNRALTQMVRKAMPKPAESNDEALSGDSKDFLAQLSLPARLASEQSGVPHHLILAQAALESGWGQRQIRRENGEPSFNILVLKPLLAGKARRQKSRRQNMKMARRLRSKPNSASIAPISKLYQIM